MNTNKTLMFVIGIFFNAFVFAQTEFTGKWQGQLTISADTVLNVQFIVDTKEDGSQSVIITSPDDGAIKDESASAVDISANTVTLEFASLNGKYKGVVENGILTGEWLQLNESFSLVLTPVEIPIMTAEDIEMLLGEWSGVGKLPRREVQYVIHFDTDEEGNLVLY